MTTIEAVLGEGDAAEQFLDMLRGVSEDARQARSGVERLDQRVEQLATELKRLNGNVRDNQERSKGNEQALWGRAGSHGVIGDVENLKGQPPPGMVTMRSLIAAVVGVAVVFGSVAAVVGLS